MKLEISGQTPANIWEKKTIAYAQNINFAPNFFFKTRVFKAEILYMETKVFQEGKFFGQFSDSPLF